MKRIFIFILALALLLGLAACGMAEEPTTPTMAEMRTLPDRTIESTASAYLRPLERITRITTIAEEPSASGDLRPLARRTEETTTSGGLRPLARRTTIAEEPTTDEYPLRPLATRTQEPTAPTTTH